jgi:hypothetical protein
MSFYAQYPSSAGGSNPSIGTNGATAPTSSTELGGINPSGNLQPLQTDASGNLKVSLAADPIDPLGTNVEQFGGSAVVTGVGNSGAGIPRVTISSDSNLNNISGTISLPTGAATQTTLATVSSTLSSILTDLTNGSQVTTVAAGNAIIGKVGIDQTTPGTTNGVQVNAALPAGTNVIGHVIVDSTGTGPADLTASGNITTQNLNPNSGTATAGSTVSVTSLNGQTSASIQVSGAYTGALTAQMTTDGTNWIALGFIQNVNTASNVANIASATDGIFQADLAGATAFRITALAAMTGTAVVTIRVTTGSSLFALDAPIPAGTNSIGNIGTVTTVTGVTTVSTVSAVTAITNALPAGTNAIGTLNPTKGTLTDNSSTTSATPSTSTTLMSSNASRKYLLIQNLSSSSTIWINFTSAATAGAGSIELVPYGSLVQETNFVSTEAITVLSTAASVPYSAKQA